MSGARCKVQVEGVGGCVSLTNCAMLEERGEVKVEQICYMNTLTPLTSRLNVKTQTRSIISIYWTIARFANRRVHARSCKGLAKTLDDSGHVPNSV
jgi:hypothetical protein